MANSVVSVAANGQQQTVLAPSGSLSGSAVTPLTALLGPDGATLISSTNPLNTSTIATLGSKTFTAVTVGTSAVQLLAANTSRKDSNIYNNGSATIYLGKDNTVTTSNGLPLPVGVPFSDKHSSDAWWAISGTAGQDVRVEETA